MKKICFAFLTALMLGACGNGGVDGDTPVIDSKSLVIDVRTAQEYREGHLKNAINIPHDEIKNRITDAAPDKNQKIILYCRSGRRSGIAEKALKDMGYTNTLNAGAYEKLKQSGDDKRQYK